jgi:hypothetical protein
MDPIHFFGGLTNSKLAHLAPNLIHEPSKAHLPSKAHMHPIHMVMAQWTLPTFHGMDLGPIRSNPIVLRPKLDPIKPNEVSLAH